MRPDYEAWIDARSDATEREGIAVARGDLCSEMFPHQADLVTWALARASAGIGSEGVVALEEGRRFVGAELKASYYGQAARNLEEASVERQPGLFTEVAP